MAGRSIPKVRPFSIPELGWTFHDKRTLPNAAYHECSKLWLGHVTSLMSRNRSISVSDICGVSPQKAEDARRRFGVRQRADPSLRWKDFRESGAAFPDENAVDPRLPQIYFCVRDKAGWIGALPASNVLIEEETDRSITASAFFFAGLPSSGGMNEMETLVVVYLKVLNDTLVLEDARSLDLLQYNLMSSPSQRARMSGDREIASFITMMKDNFDTRGDPRNLTEAIRFRRRAD